MNYSHALAAAIKAAHLAGEILREDFYRPGGPRGNDQHAEADDLAEAAIRGCLRGATPDYGIVGEELGRENLPPVDPEYHVWLVDPNDGTASYLKGHRGTAVSIALLRDGQPVLGVVYAFAAPQEDYDLISWAEGETLKRNGREVVRPSWAKALQSTHTVLVSQSADKATSANLANVTPARFRSMPSIAYRLALAAVGEAQAAVSLNGPCGWDYAGGHALLHASGGELLDARGKPVRYSRDGESHCGGNCFGGSPAICDELRKANWTEVLRPAGRTATAYDLEQPRAGWSVKDAGLLARAQGCLVGQLAGDTLGGLVEFSRPEEIVAAYPLGVRTLVDGGYWGTIAGQPTDDSELALMLARSLLQAGAFHLPTIARAYASWYSSKPFDMGSTISIGLKAAADGLRSDADPAKSAINSASRQSQSNGSLMRISPLGIFGHARPSRELVEWARADASLTHAHPICQDASAVFMLAIQAALTTGGSAIDVFEQTLGYAQRESFHPEIIGVLEAAAHSRPADYVQNMGWVKIALQNAFFQLLHSKSLEASMVDTIMLGGDTDTNAAIAGALLGAVHGISAIPIQWRDRVLTCRPVPGLTLTRHPRPRDFWPVDALILAEHLLFSGLPAREP